ncbi:unnamed protein product [Acanthoscelides obtectus]|uniref:Uncharacterized protein n=1 Tax=Acanthoscelides obtectus TaxID=200917 RepID=A0A9P0LU18_ACAOB|nr:unnamed protein product [Acanthoscelides obtectus]CAK1646614.1 hypothetical protein AOBTE_LOCUS14751 [Acanthoscelides obtectus]
MPYDVTLFWHQYPWLLGKRACQSRALISETTYVGVSGGPIKIHNCVRSVYATPIKVIFELL